MYQQSVEKQKRTKKRLEEERGASTASAQNYTSWFLRYLVSAQDVSAEGFDVLYPQSLTSLFHKVAPPTALIEKFRASDSRSSELEHLSLSQREQNATNDQVNATATQTGEDSTATDLPLGPPTLSASGSASSDLGHGSSSDLGLGPTNTVMKFARSRSMTKPAPSLSTGILSFLSRSPSDISDALGRASSVGKGSFEAASTERSYHDQDSPDGITNRYLDNHNKSVDFVSAARLLQPSYGILDASLWKSSGMFCGYLEDQRRVSDHDRWFDPFRMSTDWHADGRQQARQMVAEGADVPGTYRVYQTKVGASGVGTLMDSAVRLFIYIKGAPPDNEDLRELSDAVCLTAKCWDRHGLPWVVNQSSQLGTSLAIKTDLDHKPSLPGDPPVEADLTSLASLTDSCLSSHHVEELFDFWICSSCGKEVQMWSSPETDLQEVLDGVSYKCLVLFCLFSS